MKRVEHILIFFSPIWEAQTTLQEKNASSTNTFQVMSIWYKTLRFPLFGTFIFKPPYTPENNETSGKQNTLCLQVHIESIDAKVFFLPPNSFDPILPVYI